MSKPVEHEADEVLVGLFNSRQFILERLHLFLELGVPLDLRLLLVPVVVQKSFRFAQIIELSLEHPQLRRRTSHFLLYVGGSFLLQSQDRV